MEELYLPLIRQGPNDNSQEQSDDVIVWDGFCELHNVMTMSNASLFPDRRVYVVFWSIKALGFKGLDAVATKSGKALNELR